MSRSYFLVPCTEIRAELSSANGLIEVEERATTKFVLREIEHREENTDCSTRESYAGRSSLRRRRRYCHEFGGRLRHHRRRRRTYHRQPTSGGREQRCLRSPRSVLSSSFEKAYLKGEVPNEANLVRYLCYLDADGQSMRRQFHHTIFLHPEIAADIHARRWESSADLRAWEALR
jgi:hypothetical protein